MLWLAGLSAGLIDDLLLLPQDYRSSSPGGEGNLSEHGGEKQREERGQRERERGMEVERCVYVCVCACACKWGDVLYENERKDRRGQVGGKQRRERGKEIERIRGTR